MNNAKDDVKKLGTILGIWAHPDDETYCMGGIMAAAVKNGQKVICITATRGEAGVQDEIRWPAEQLASIRTNELEAAMKILGVEGHNWLDYPDGGCSQVDEEEAVSKISVLIEKHRPDTIMTFGPEGMTGHPDHQSVSHWASAAARNKGVSLYHAVQTDEQYEAMREVDKHLNIFFNVDKPKISKACDCSLCFELSDEIYEIKLAALKAMPSQTETMLKTYGSSLRDSLGTEAFTKS